VGVVAILARVVALLLVRRPWRAPVVGMRGRRNGHASEVAIARRSRRRWREGHVSRGGARGLGRRRRYVLMHCCCSGPLGYGCCRQVSRSATVCALAHSRPGRAPATATTTTTTTTTVDGDRQCEVQAWQQRRRLGQPQRQGEGGDFGQQAAAASTASTKKGASDGVYKRARSHHDMTLQSRRRPGPSRCCRVLLCSAMLYC